MNKEFNGFDEMVEALEENEDMVECKECFDLVPKVDCERSEVGYVCPVCKGLRTAPAQARFVDPYDSYTQEFPEVTEYDPGAVVEYEKEPGLGDALADLIRDEYEAIDGYEVADETIQHADIEEDEKDEILDTLDHIKEEEEEHIDELKELCPECDPVAEPETEPETEPKAEPEKLEEAADDEAAAEEAEVEEIPEEDIPEEEAEESEENENEEVSDLDSAYEAALEIANESGVGQVFGYARKETEEFVAVEPFEVDDPEAVEDDLMAVYDDVAYAYVAYPEKELSEALFESVQLNEGPLSYLRKKVTNQVENLDGVFDKGYKILIQPPKGEDKPPEHGRTAKSIADAEKAAKAISQKYPKSGVYVVAVAIDKEKLASYDQTIVQMIDQREDQVPGKGMAAILLKFVNGKSDAQADKCAKLNKLLRTIDSKNKTINQHLDSEETESDVRDTTSTDSDSDSDSDVATVDDTTSDEVPSTDPKKSDEVSTDTEKSDEVADSPKTDDTSAVSAEAEETPATEPSENEKSREKNKTYHGHALSDKAIGNFKKLMYLTGLKVYDAMGNQVPADKTGIVKIKPETLLDFEIEINGERKPLNKWLETMVKNKIIAESFANEILGTASTLTEEYHKYANPAELAAMKDVEDLVATALTKVYGEITAWGYEAEEVDSQSFMSQEDEACLQYMVNFQDLSADEIEDLADQIQMQLENELSAYKPVPEICGVSCSVALPDYDLADEDDAAEGITRASILVYVTFARNLF
jgi:hypothetical protein